MSLIRKNPIAQALGSGLSMPLSALPTAAPHEPAPRVARRKLWTLDRKFHCLIIGSCIDAETLRGIARRHRFCAAADDDYANHVEAVGWCGTRNAVSEALQQHLDTAYASALTAAAAARNDAAVLTYWQAAWARGDVAGPLWTAMTHKHASDDTRHALYAAVHMLSHQVGAGMAADVRRLACLEADAKTWDSERQRLQTLLDERARISAGELATLHARLAELAEDNARLRADRARLDALESGLTMTRMGQELMALREANRVLQAAAARADVLAERHAQAQTALSAAQATLARQAQERRVLERLLGESTEPAEPTSPMAAPADADADAADCLRCAQRQPLQRARCILCVGGRTSLLSHYRALADRLGLRLLHHDGGQEETLSRLPDLIASADAVLCPTDCVGHAAYYAVKQHCRKSGKPCLLYKGAGVTNFAFALSRVSAGESSLGHGPRDHRTEPAA